MPSDRFFRLPEEKIEHIRKAAVKEFIRVTPEEASINKIIQDADISRGSFYTYFDSKYDLLRWLISDKVKMIQEFYKKSMEKNRGDIWLVFDEALRLHINLASEPGFVELINNFVRSSMFTELIKEGVEKEYAGEISDSKRTYISKLYELLDKGKCPLDFAGFYALVDMHMMVLMMSLEAAAKDRQDFEQVKEVYQRHMSMLRYGAVHGGQMSNE